MNANYRLGYLWVVLCLVIIPQLNHASLRASYFLRQKAQTSWAWRCIPPGFCWKEDQTKPWMWEETHYHSGVIKNLDTSVELQWRILPSDRWHKSLSSALRKEFELLGFEVLQQTANGNALTLTIQTKNHADSWQQQLLLCRGHTLVLTGPLGSSTAWSFPEVICRE